MQVRACVCFTLVVMACVTVWQQYTDDIIVTLMLVVCMSFIVITSSSIISTR